jgi:hypothetical protein
MPNLNDKATVIIRSVGERTEQLCRELILAQGVSAENVVIVHEAPFSAAMRKSFETGLQRGLPWTFCVDADLLLRPGAVETMLRLAEAQPENICEIQGYILDKFYGGPRQGGVHLYRTALLPLVLTNIPAEGVNVRPEFHTLEAMKAQGYPYASVQYVVGLHDFEQYYRDIFRKCLVHAHKHQDLTDLFLSYWREQARTDKDFAVALKGYAAGVEYYGGVLIDTQQDIYQESFGRLGITEKQNAPDGYTLSDIEDIIAHWSEPQVYQRKFPTKMGLINPAQLRPPMRHRFMSRLSELGIKIVPYSLGWLLTTLGKKILSWVQDRKE